jgi:pimeloyl-ACP methyl ester carboxylesterase
VQRPTTGSVGDRVRLVGDTVANYLRRYLFAPRYRPAERLRLVGRDGTRLSGARLAGPPSAPATVVLVHGFVNSSRTPAIHDFARRLARQVHVLVPDLRGHGASGGRCTMGVDEPGDVATVVAAAPPGLPVVTMGTSLGAAAVLLHAGRYGGVAGTVAISAPAWWGSFDREGSDRVRRFIGSPIGRAVLGLLLRTRVVPSCAGVPDASEAVASISPAFTIVVHDPDDRYFGPEHAERLDEWAREPKALWWYSGAGHGTDLLTPELADRLLGEIHARFRPAAGLGSSAGEPPADPIAISD